MSARGEGSERPDSPSATGASYLDVREEWGGERRAGAEPGPRQEAQRARPPSAQPPPPPPPARDGKRPNQVRGVARGIEFQKEANGAEYLAFRIDQYDAAGNRLAPVAVEMRGYRRGGRVSDGDEVVAIGKWSHGTLRASRVSNVTTASEILGFPRLLKWILTVLLLFGLGGCVALIVFDEQLTSQRDDPARLTVNVRTGQILATRID